MNTVGGPLQVCIAKKQYAKHWGKSSERVDEHTADAANRQLAQDATHHVDPSRPRRLPLRSNAMQGLNRLLFRGFHCRRRVHRKWLCFSGCVESKRSAVAYRTGGAEYERRLSLSFSPRSPSFRFPPPLIEPDVTISVIPSVDV